MGVWTAIDVKLDQPRGYYDLPILKRPHWRWEIVGYFWIGGIAAGSYAVAAIADLAGDEGDRPVVRAGRLIAFPLVSISPLLLIKDLGRPLRFLNMLRTINPRSPMSTGSWALLIFGGWSALSAALELAPHPISTRRKRRLVGALGLPWALFVGGYTGVLLSASAIPLWARNRRLWGPTFLLSAFSTGAAAIHTALALRGDTHASTLAKLDRVHRLSVAGEAAALLLGVARLGSAGRVLRRGRRAAQFWGGAIGLGIGLPLLLDARGSHSRRLTLLKSLSVLAGGLCLRASIVYGGQDSADDPQAYFDVTQPR